MSLATADPCREACLDLAPEAAPQRGPYYGWVILGLSIAALVASSPGQTFGVSVFNEPLRSDLGLNFAGLAAAYTLGTLLGAVPIAFIGRFMDRFGIRRTLMVIVTLFTAACLVTAGVQSWAGLVLAFTLLRMLGAGALSLVSGSMLSFWFDRRLGMVEGIRHVGMAGAMAVIPVTNLWLESTVGWRGAYCCFGIVIWVVLFPAMAVLCRDHPNEVGQRIDGDDERGETLRRERGTIGLELTLPEALRTATFWIVCSGTALFGLIHTALFFSIVPILDERGLTATDATAMLTALAVSLAVMQLIGGILADAVPASRLLAAGAATLCAGVALLTVATSVTLAVGAGAVLGISQGLYFGAVQPLWARYYGRRHLGAIRGMLMTINVAASSLGPLFAGVVRDLTGTFTIALVTFAIAPFFVAMLSLGVAPPRPAPRGGRSGAPSLAPR